MALSLGYTIAELQDRITYREFLVWYSYFNKYGPLNPVRKYDQGNAIVASQINQSHGGKAAPIDFMPFAPKPEEKDSSVEEFIQALGKGAKIGR